ncbi:fumarate hydratase, partial [Candidatus Cloacimonadota bacterium]
LAVKIMHKPCHIASMPVAVNVQCHAARHKSIII